MSLAITIAQAMADRINAAPSLPDVTAMVYRQKTLASELATKLAKAGGAVIVILYEGFTNPDAGSATHPAITRRFTVTLFAKPLLREDAEMAADDIVEITARILHNWEPLEATAGFAEIHVKGCDLRPDDKFLIYDLEVEVESRL